MSLEPCARCGAIPSLCSARTYPRYRCGGWVERDGERKRCVAAGPAFSVAMLGLAFARGRAKANWNRQQREEKAGRGRREE